MELKAGKGVVSGAQRLAMRQIEWAGGDCHVCNSLDQVVEALRSWGIPTKLAARPLGATR
mgnify:CR=1 FL=1